MPFSEMTMRPLEGRTAVFAVMVGLFFIIVIGFIDSRTGYELSFSPFYLLPIIILAWFIGLWGGILGCGVSVFIWQLADLTSLRTNLYPGFYIWNSVMRLIIYLVVGILVPWLKNELRKQTELAISDPLTQALNGRSFSALLQSEINRSIRYHHPFSVVFFDLDNFKAVNDRLGHKTGDRILMLIVDVTKGILRQTDVIARMGGDEFAILLPETEDKEAQELIDRVQIELNNEMMRAKVPVSFSIGVITVHDVGEMTVDKLISEVDQLMYQAKHGGKNTICYKLFPD